MGTNRPYSITSIQKKTLTHTVITLWVAIIRAIAAPRAAGCLCKSIHPFPQPGQLPLIFYASFTVFISSLFWLPLGLLPGRSILSSLSRLSTVANRPNLLSNMLCPHSFLILSLCITPKESLQRFHLCHPRLCFLSLSQHHQMHLYCAPWLKSFPSPWNLLAQAASPLSHPRSSINPQASSNLKIPLESLTL